MPEFLLERLKRRRRLWSLDAEMLYKVSHPEKPIPDEVGFSRNEDEPRFSIIIPVRNDSEYIAGCLESLAAQRCDDYEIIFVDAGCRDDSLHQIKNFFSEHEELQERHRVFSLEKEDLPLDDDSEFVLDLLGRISIYGEYVFGMKPQDRFYTEKALAVISAHLDDIDNPDTILLPYSGYGLQDSGEEEAVSEENNHLRSICIRRAYLNSIRNGILGEKR